MPSKSIKCIRSPRYHLIFWSGILLSVVHKCFVKKSSYLTSHKNKSIVAKRSAGHVTRFLPSSDHWDESFIKKILSFSIKSHRKIKIATSGNCSTGQLRYLLTFKWHWVNSIPTPIFVQSVARYSNLLHRELSCWFRFLSLSLPEPLLRALQGIWFIPSI